jgi:uncharacterized protein YgiM (DUF1202 family)
VNGNGLRLSAMRLLAVALVAVGFLVGSGALAGRSAAAAQNDGAYRTTRSTYLRVKPNGKSAAVIKLKAGSIVVAEGPLAGYKDGVYRWVYVSWTVQGHEAEGWASASALTRFGASPGNAVTTANVNLRAAPNRDAEVYLVIPSGTGITILDGTPINGYVLVEYSWIEGYVSANYLGRIEA